MYQSLRRLAALPDNPAVYPGASTPPNRPRRWPT
jgi:hypothetical protein